MAQELERERACVCMGGTQRGRPGSLTVAVESDFFPAVLHELNALLGFPWFFVFQTLYYNRYFITLMMFKSMFLVRMMS